jgi:UTP-glucose-1-phosphate uridylyltransferase
MKPTLLILAAGMGRRYNGLKQIEPAGPNGELIIDYSIYDAIKAGFGKVVFVIRHEFEEAFKQNFGAKYADHIEVAYAYQETDSCISDLKISANREKPWGTGHAILVAKDVINEPFAVINADDFYGSGAFKVISEYLADPSRTENDFCMVGYNLINTLSEYGSVCRGICELNKHGFLKKITEHTKVEKDNTEIKAFDGSGNECLLAGQGIVSMNLWGFKPSIFDLLKSQFDDFIKENDNDPKAEFFIPTVIDSLIHKKIITVKVLKTNEKWFGITYPQDKVIAAACINKLIGKGVYPERLWSK